MFLSPPDPVYVMRGEMEMIHCLHFNITKNVEQIFAGTEGGKIHIWNLKTNREIDQLCSDNGPCLSVNKINENYLIAQRKSELLEVWKTTESTWIFDKSINTGFVGYCRCQVATNDSLFVPLNDSKIGYFSVKNMKSEFELDIKTLPNRDQIGQTMAIKPVAADHSQLLAAYDGGYLLLWDLKKRAVISSLKISECPMAIDFQKTYDRGLIGSNEKDLKSFSLKNDELKFDKTLSLKSSGISVVTIRPDSKIFATGGWDCQIRVFSFKTLKPLAMLDFHSSTIQDIVFTREKSEAYNCDYLMAATGKDGCISFWNLYN